MAIIQDPHPGSSASVTVDPMFKAMRLSLRPSECQGAYRLSQRSGTIAAATAAGIQFMFRYYGTGSCQIHSVKVGLQSTLAYTQNNMSFTLNVVRGWSISDTGGTQATLGNIQKVRSAMTQSQVDIRYPTTGTLTTAAVTASIEDPAPFASVQMDCPGAPLRSQPMQEFLDASWFAKPLTLTMNEGFRIRNTAYGATGTSVVIFSVYWSEFPAESTHFY